MPLIASETNRKNIEPIPPGVHAALCYGVIDLGTQPNRKFGGEHRQVLLQWELPACRGEFEKDGDLRDLPRAISRRYTLSLDEKSNLRRELESWRGRKFTDEELSGFDLQNLLGANCQIQVVHQTKLDGGIFAGIGAIMALPQGSSVPKETENPHTFFAFDGEVDNPELPKGIPEWVIDIIMESNEWRTASERKDSVGEEQTATSMETVTNPDPF